TLLGLPPSSPIVRELVDQVSKLASLEETPSPDIKIYRSPKPGVLYANYYQLGLSFLYSPDEDAGDLTIDESHLTGDELKLDSIDIYNIPDGELRRPSSKSPAYSSYPALNIILSPSPQPGDSEPITFEISKASTGKSLLAGLGEPDRKGGGSGPSSGSIGIWCEWSKKGIMVEFGGDESRGPQAWEKGKDAKWKILTLFRPK
ncbi:hypothetical protein SCHPADRAFT_813012, partial [Schizopora paradoxa]